MLVPFLETNCEVTPTSKVAKTGEWSLVTTSSVQPEEEERRSERAGRASAGGGRAGGGGGTYRRSYRRCASPGRTSTGCGHTRRGRWSSSGGRNNEGEDEDGGEEEEVGGRRNSPRSPSASATRRCLWSRARSGTSAGRRSPPRLQAKNTRHRLFSWEGGAPPAAGLDYIPAEMQTGISNPTP